MSIDRAGVPFILGGLGLAVVFSVVAHPLWSVPWLVLALAFGLFFRDPERRTEAGADQVVAPADGRVVVAGAATPDAAPPGDWTQLSIFLSPLNVHVNRIPVTGRLTKVDYRPGRCLAAFRPEATTENERNELWIDTGTYRIVCRQITGVLVRRVVCRVRAGDAVKAGDRFGVMKFGSRIDLFLPPGTRLAVAVGDRVRGGETIVATLA